MKNSFLAAIFGLVVVAVFTLINFPVFGNYGSSSVELAILSISIVIILIGIYFIARKYEVSFSLSDI